MYKYLLIPVAIFVIGCQPPPSHKMEGYVIQSDEPIRLLQIEDIDTALKTAPKHLIDTWNHNRRMAVRKLEEQAMYL